MRHCSMKHRDAADETVCRILSGYSRIAIVGLSGKPWRDSYRVACYLLEQGYRVIPINPEVRDVLGLPSYPDLRSVPGTVEVVNVFRRLEHVPAVVNAAIERGAGAVWTQYGLIDEESAERARQAGLLVVMNRCIMAEHTLHFT